MTNTEYAEKQPLNQVLVYELVISNVYNVITGK